MTEIWGSRCNLNGLYSKADLIPGLTDLPSPFPLDFDQTGERLLLVQLAERDFRAALRLGESLARAHGIGRYEWGIPLADFLVGAKRCAEARPLLAGALAEIEGARRPVAPLWRLQQRLLEAHCARGSAQGAEAKTARASLRAIPGVEVDLYPTARALLAD